MTRYSKSLLMKSIAAVVALSAAIAFGGERPPQAPPIDERLTGIEARLDAVETDVRKIKDTLEGKTAKSCPCPEGDCICGADCQCPDCPIHKRGNGPRILLFTADWCAPCQAAKARLGELVDRLETVDCTNGNPRPEFGEVYYPTAILLDENGKELRRCVGEHVGTTIIGGWLENKPVGAGLGVEPGNGSRPRRVYYSSPRYYEPQRVYYSPPVYYRSYGGCPTCR